VTLPYRWHPTGTRPKAKPAAGALVAYEHQVWRVVSFTRRPPELWSDEACAMVARYGPHYEPHAIVLRQLDVSDDPKNRGRDLHLESRGYRWDVYPDEHYPVCASCMEPMPCRERTAERESKAAAERMGRFEMPGVCPACAKPVSSRQKSMTFPDNLEVPGGPPVTFHVGRYGCRGSAARYEERWVAADPGRRKAVLSCRGEVTRHGDGTYECTAPDDCPGPEARHGLYSTCDCPDCHARGPFDCHPVAGERRRPPVPVLSDTTEEETDRD
jgi:hypothetical protein